MRSRLLKLALMPMLLLVPGCVSSPPIIASKAACSTLVPETWRAGVGVGKIGAVEPTATDLERLKIWQQFAIDTVGRVITADSRTADTIGIIERCEARDAAAVRKARPRFLGIF